jgi:hypothetical protein
MVNPFLIDAIKLNSKRNDTSKVFNRYFMELSHLFV